MTVLIVGQCLRLGLSCYAAKFRRKPPKELLCSIKKALPKIR